MRLKQLENKKQKYSISIFYLLFIATVFTINKGIFALSSISYFVIIAIVIISNLKTSIALLFCLLPFQRIFLLSKSFMTLIPFFLLTIIIKYLLKGKIKKSILNSIAACFVLLIYSGIVEYIRLSSFNRTLQYVVTIIVMIIICDVIDDKLRFDCFKFYCFSAFLSGIIGYLMPKVSDYTALFSMEYNARLQGLMADPGEFGQMIVTAIAMSLALCSFLNKSKKNICKKIYIFLTIIYDIIMFGFAILSGTRACLIGLAVIYGYALYYFLRTKNRKQQILGAIFFVVSIFLISSLSSFLFDIVSTAHGGEQLLDDSRLMIWSGYFKHIVSNFEIVLVGVGMDSCGAYGKTVGLGNPHNVIIEKTVENGIVGLCLNIVIFRSLLKKKKKSLYYVENLPFYVYLSTLMVYGSSGLVLPYLLLAFLKQKDKYVN